MRQEKINQMVVTCTCKVTMIYLVHQIQLIFMLIV
jgi:hypothetical protein